MERGEVNYVCVFYCDGGSLCQFWMSVGQSVMVCLFVWSLSVQGNTIYRKHHSLARLHHIIIMATATSATRSG